MWLAHTELNADLVVLLNGLGCNAQTCIHVYPDLRLQCKTKSHSFSDLSPSASYAGIPWLQKKSCVDFQEKNREWSTAGVKIWLMWVYFQSSGRMEHVSMLAVDRGFKSANSDKTPLTYVEGHTRILSFLQLSHQQYQ